MLTNNPVLVRKHVQLPALFCAQRKADKTIPTSEDFVISNIASFGNEIGHTTNVITSMFEVIAGVEKDSAEYKELDYRIKSGQTYQQNAIDKAKGIVCKPMPATWYNRHAVNTLEDEGTKHFYRKVVADKKPYFMRYIYPQLKRQYNTYIKNTNMNSLREFGMTVDELRSLPAESRTPRQNDFLSYYNYRMPVGINDCNVNKICRKIENEFDGYVSKSKKDAPPYDYTIMKSGQQYTNRQFNKIKNLYTEYSKRLSGYSMFADLERVDDIDAYEVLNVMNDDFRKECDALCPNGATLCDILLEICYNKNATKRFVWEMCGDEIIENLLNRNNRTISYPVLNPNGEFSFGGRNFTIEKKVVDNIEHSA